MLALDSALWHFRWALWEAEGPRRPRVVHRAQERPCRPLPR